VRLFFSFFKVLFFNFKSCLKRVDIPRKKTEKRLFLGVALRKRKKRKKLTKCSLTMCKIKIDKAAIAEKRLKMLQNP